MNEALKSLIENKIASEKFNITNLIESEEIVKWLPLISYGEEHQIFIGLSTKAEWVIKERDGLRILDETWKFLRLLVLLEHPRTKIYYSLMEALDRYGIFVDLDDVFPFVDIVKIGFEQKSDYWAELALNWFIDLTELKQKELLISLRKISDAEWASQKLRHKVKKVIKNLEKK